MIQLSFLLRTTKSLALLGIVTLFIRQITPAEDLDPYEGGVWRDDWDFGDD